jgi:hypothetical protein
MLSFGSEGWEKEKTLNGLGPINVTLSILKVVIHFFLTHTIAIGYSTVASKFENNARKRRYQKTGQSWWYEANQGYSTLVSLKVIHQFDPIIKCNKIIWNHCVHLSLLISKFN